MVLSKRSAVFPWKFEELPSHALGANGAGKSSTLKTISGILEPDKGRVTLKGMRSRDNRQTRVAAQGVPMCRKDARSFRFCLFAKTC